jgi:multisubunit Na+/H+ antiporter MnhE subunit
MIIAVSLFYYQLGMQRMQLGEFLFGIWLSVIVFLLGTPIFLLSGIEADKRHYTKSKDKNSAHI